jgi:uncharacterized coiled-coil protein SlyX
MLRYLGAMVLPLEARVDTLESQFSRIESILLSMQRTLEVHSEDLNEMKADIRQVKGDLGKVQGDLSKVQGDLSKVQGDLHALTDKVSGLERGYSRLNNRFSSYLEFQISGGIVSLMERELEDIPYTIFTDVVDADRPGGTDYQIDLLCVGDTMALAVEVRSSPKPKHVGEFQARVDRFLHSPKGTEILGERPLLTALASHVIHEEVIQAANLANMLTIIWSQRDQLAFAGIGPSKALVGRALRQRREDATKL